MAEQTLTIAESENNEAGTEAMRHIEEALCDGIGKAGHIDGFYFALHGALASEGIDDVSGYLLSLIRKQIGHDVPVVGSFDHHGNITHKIIENLDALVAYQFAPHIDMFETGERAGKLLIRIIDKEISPVIAWQKIPLMTPSYRFTTVRSPLKELFAAAREIEKRPGVIEAATFQVFPHLDVPELGWSTAALTNNDPALAKTVSTELAEYSWSIRDEMVPETVSPDEAIRQALAEKEGPFVIVDGDDNVNGGAPGDSTCFLKALVRAQPSRPAFLTIVDPEAVALAIAAGVGNEVSMAVGGKKDYIYGHPVQITGRVIRISDGRFSISGHIAGLVNMGRTVALAIGKIQMVISERSGVGHDPSVYTHLGLDPSKAQIVLVKCTAGHTVAYKSFMKGDIYLNCPGSAFNDLKKLEWHKIPRPLYPLDDLHSWHSN